MKTKMRFFSSLSIVLILISCGTSNKREAEMPVRVVYDNSTMSAVPQAAPAVVNTPASSGGISNQMTRQQAFDDAFDGGRQLGYSDALRGVDDAESYASCYSDDWIKQAFIQGYIYGQAQAFSESNLKEEAFDDCGEYFYLDEGYEELEEIDDYIYYEAGF